MSIRWGEKRAAEGEGGGSWQSALPEDLRGDPNIAKFKTPADLAKSYVEASRMIGSSIRPPGPDASEEAKKDFREKMMKTVPGLIYAPDGDAEAEKLMLRRLGLPEKPEEYGVDEETAKFLNLDEARQLAAEAGLTKRQFEALAKATAKQTQAQRKAAEEAHAALKSEWGQAHGERVQQAAAAAAKLGLPDTVVASVAAGQAPAEQVKFLFSVAQAVGADAKELTRERNNQPGRMTPSQAKAAIAEIYANPEHPYMNANHPHHADAIQRMQELVAATLA
jgi:hypothetical protein